MYKIFNLVVCSYVHSLMSNIYDIILAIIFIKLNMYLLVEHF